LEAAASIWTVAAIGLAVGGGLYFAAGLSTTIILAVLAGVKPLEEAYRDRNQTRQLVIETVRGVYAGDFERCTLGTKRSEHSGEPERSPD